MLTTRMLLPPLGLFSVRGALQDTVPRAIADEIETDDAYDGVQQLAQSVAAVLSLVLYVCLKALCGRSLQV
jgi:hypothetical protein